MTYTVSVGMLNLTHSPLDVEHFCIEVELFITKCYSMSLLTEET